MNENLEPNESPENIENKTVPEIIVNDYGATKDGAVVIEEDNRTVLLTEDKAIVIEKEPQIDIVPKNRPRKVYGGMWGQIEIATVGMSMLAVLAMIILIVLVVLPAKKELEENKARRNGLEAEMMSARSKYGTITTTEARVAELIGSVNDFETRFLRPPVIGKTDLYQRLNGLISSYNLINTTGPDYTPLEISDKKSGQNKETERGKAKFQSIYPGVYVTMTVEGSYQNLRRFIRDIETTNDQFVVISAVELQPSENESQNKSSQPTQASSNNPPVNPNNPAGAIQNTGFEPSAVQPAVRIVSGKTRGETVSLRLEMATYFRRPDFQPVESSVSSR